MANPTALAPEIVQDLNWLRALATRLAQDRDEAEDLVQESLLAAWTNDPSRSESLRPWLATVLRNAFRMRRRAQMRRENRERREDPGFASQSPETEVIRLEVMSVLLEKLQALPEQDRLILCRRFFEGQNASQIGRDLQMQPATVRSRMHRCLQHLRSELDERFGGTRATWAAVFYGAPPPASPVEGATASMGMPIAATAAVALAGCVWLAFATPSAETVPAAEAKKTPATSEVTSKSSSARDLWQQRREAVTQAQREAGAPAELRASPPHDPAFFEEQMMAEIYANEAWIGTCLEEAESLPAEAVRIDYDIHAAPDIGMILDNIRVLEGDIANTDLMECIEQSMYAFLGPAPEKPFTSKGSWHFVPLGNPRKHFDVIMQAHLSSARMCERPQQPAGSPPKGRLLLEIVAGGGHNPTKARVLETDLPQEVSRCLVQTARTLPFPENLRGQTFQHEYVLPLRGDLARADEEERALGSAPPLSP